MDERYDKTLAALRASGADWAVLTQPDTVAYATGHLTQIETGPTPFAGGPATAILGRDGSCALVMSNVETTDGTFAPGERYVYDGFSCDRYVDQSASYTACLEKALRALGVAGKIAGEPRSFPLAATALLEGAALIDITPRLDRERALKTDAEKLSLRRSADAAALGQRTFHEVLRKDRTELDVFADVRCAIERFAGERVPIAGDCVSGIERTSAVGGWATRRMIREGEPVILDLAPRVAGYWGDSCSTSAAGERTDGHRRLFRASQEALQHGISILRPGMPMVVLDKEMRAVVAKHGFSYPHHSGHSIGTSVHEWPRIIPRETAAVEAGMFLMLEPSAYDSQLGGARLEWMIEVTASGGRPVAPFEHRDVVPM